MGSLACIYFDAAGHKVYEIVRIYFKQGALFSSLPSSDIPLNGDAFGDE